MGQPAAAQGDLVTADDIHMVVQSSTGAVMSVPLPFSGALTQGLSPTVRIGGRPAAVVGSGAINQPPHLPPPSTTFLRPPTNTGIVAAGSTTVRINGRFAARAGDPVLTCNDPADRPDGRVTAAGTVRIG